MVVYCAGFPAIYGRQPLYFQDETFAARAAIPAPKGSDSLSSLGSDHGSRTARGSFRHPGRMTWKEGPPGNGLLLTAWLSHTVCPRKLATCVRALYATVARRRDRA